MDAEKPFYYEDGRGGIFDAEGNEASQYDEASSFRLKKITDLKKMVKNDFDFDLQLVKETAVNMTEAIPKKERETEYNQYTEKDRLMYFYFLKEKGMGPKKAAEAANVNYHTARKWKQQEKETPDEFVLHKKTNPVPTRPKSKLDNRHKEHVKNFFDKNSRATISDAVDDLTKSFKGLEIKKSRVAEFMKEECNTSMKRVSRQPVAINSAI